LPEGTRISKGRSISNFLSLQKEEAPAAMLCVKEFSEDLNIMLATRKGVIKKTQLSEYQNFRKGGTIGITVDEGDQVISAKLTRGEDQVILVTRAGMSVRFAETDARTQGRATRGVKGITLKSDDDEVVAMEVVNPNATLLTAGRDGYGKRTSYEEYRIQSRGGSGIIAIKSDEVAGALSVTDTDEIMLITQQGQSVRTRVNEIRVIGRSTQGVRLINLAKGDTLVGLCRVAEPAEEEEASE
jgi:DNA gyrase subunit A